MLQEVKEIMTENWNIIMSDRGVDSERMLGLSSKVLVQDIKKCGCKFWEMIESENAEEWHESKIEDFVGGPVLMC